MEEPSTSTHKAKMGKGNVTKVDCKKRKQQDETQLSSVERRLFNKKQHEETSTKTRCTECPPSENNENFIDNSGNNNYDANKNNDNPVQPEDIAAVRNITSDGVAGLAVAKKVSEGDEEDPMNLQEAVEYDPKSPIIIMNKKSLYVFIGITLTLAALVGSIVATQVTDTKHDTNNDDIYNARWDEDASTMTPTNFRETLGIQGLLEKVVGIEKLWDNTTAQYKAMEWIILYDPMQLHADAENLVQRYLLAVFYFSTSSRGPWRSCNPPRVGENNTCQFQRLTSVDQIIEFQAVKWFRWLSDRHECEWAGIHCEENQTSVIQVINQRLQGTIPLELTQLPYLRYINLSWNKLTGTIPPEISQMIYINNIQMHFNLFTGAMPTELGSLDDMEQINIAGNLLSGALPSEIGKIRGLKGLFAYDNMIGGSLPTEIGWLTSLIFLRAQINKISGTLPSEMGQMAKIREIWFAKNSLEGVIPSEIGNLRALRDLRLQKHFKLIGTIPEELYNVNSLYRIDLQDCNITGTISSRIGRLKSLNVLRVSNNQLSGTLPESLSLLHFLGKTWIQGNNFTGSVPTRFCARQMSQPNKQRELSAECLFQPDEYVIKRDIDNTTMIKLSSPFIKCEPLGCCTTCCSSNICRETFNET